MLKSLKPLFDPLLQRRKSRLIRVPLPGQAHEQLDHVFAALADPTRRAILSRLAEGDTSVTALAAPFRMSLPAVSKHLKVLARAGLITRSRVAQVRPCRIKAAPLKEAVDWLEHYRQFWEQSFDRLDEYLKQLQTKDKK